ncbi:hypothetical protein NL50_17445 [Clostridium acetobutylicum]|nr:hypothetical protein NL50_17445 [Clostridium acetobutylicum]
MKDFVLHILFTNSIETLFLIGFIFIFYNNRYNLIEKIFIFIFLDIFSNRIQYISSPVNIVIGILMYWLIFINNYKSKFKLLQIICTGFFIIATIQLVIYSPLILFLHLNIDTIHNNTIFLILTMIPIDIIEILLLIIIRRKKRNENR